MNLTHYWQNSLRWKDAPLGFGNEGQTISTHGCLLCCVASVFQYMTGEQMPPDRLNEELRNIRGFQGAYMDTGAVEMLSGRLTGADFISCRNYAAPVSEIDYWLRLDVPVIVEIDRSDQPGVQEHWVTIVEKVGDDYLVYDPLHSENDNPRALSELYPHGDPEVIILGILTYKSKLIPPVVMPGAFVDVKLSGLNIRNRPDTDDRHDIGDLVAGQRLEYAGETVVTGSITWAKVYCYVALKQGDREFARLVEED